MPGATHDPARPVGLNPPAGAIGPVVAGGAGAALVVISAALATTNPVVLAANCVLGWTLLALAWIDLRALRLPDWLTLPLLMFGLVMAWHDGEDPFLSAAFGAAAGYAVFAAVGFVYRIVRGQEGLGRGDAKLLAAGGAWIGWESLPMTVLLAALTGLGIALAARVGGSAVTRDTVVPFGPPLAFGIWIMRLYDVRDWLGL